MDITLLARTLDVRTAFDTPQDMELTACAPTDLQGGPQTPKQWLSELSLL